jgi:Stress responsive A/B Barrel Domain
MIAHVVLMTPRPDLSAADRQTFLTAFESALRNISSVRNVRIGRRVLHGAGYETAAAAGEYFAIIDFENMTGLQSYLGDPAHEEVGRRLYQVMSSVAVYDFEVGGIEELARLTQSST